MSLFLLFAGIKDGGVLDIVQDIIISRDMKNTKISFIQGLHKTKVKEKLQTQNELKYR